MLEFGLGPSGVSNGLAKILGEFLCMDCGIDNKFDDY